jgi:hypothetical protein
MSHDFWLGLAAIPALLVLIAVALGVALGLLWLWGRLAPSHWAVSGVQRHARPAIDVFRHVNVAGGHVKTLRKVVRVGPWSLLLIRYAPGNVEDREPERIP